MERRLAPRRINEGQRAVIIRDVRALKLRALEILYVSDSEAMQFYRQFHTIFAAAGVTALAANPVDPSEPPIYGLRVWGAGDSNLASALRAAKLEIHEEKSQPRVCRLQNTPCLIVGYPIVR